MGPEDRAIAISRDMIGAEAAARFWSKVARSDGCWTWTAGRQAYGYGAFKTQGKQLSAHRVAFALTYGEAPALLQIRHTCDNPPCCRPDHLLVGTSADNNRDRAERKRSGACNNDWSAGEKNGAAKLTWDKVRKIREAYCQPGATVRKLAKQFNTGKSTIALIVQNRLWREASP